MTYLGFLSFHKFRQCNYENHYTQLIKHKFSCNLEEMTKFTKILQRHNQKYVFLKTNLYIDNQI